MSISISIILLLVSSLLQAQVAHPFSSCHPSIPIISTPTKKERCNNYNRVNQKLKHQLQCKQFASIALHSIKSHHDDGEEEDGDNAINDKTYNPNIPYEILPLDQVLNHLVVPITTTNKNNNNEQSLSLQHHIQTGLSSSQASQLLSQIGYNTLIKREQTSIWELWVQQFDDTLVRILVLVALVSAVFSVSEVWDLIQLDQNVVDNNNGGMNMDIANDILNVISTNPNLKSTIVQSIVEPSIIIAILLLNALVGVWQDLSARSSLDALEKMQPKLATVLRCYSKDDSNKEEEEVVVGRWITEYDATQLVPGDIIKIRVGDSIPADARLISLTSSTMYVDESSLTGESVSVGKLPGDEGLKSSNVVQLSEQIIDDATSDNNNNIDVDDENESLSIPIQDQKSMLFSGSLITRGSGIAIVVRTGQSTQIGKIQSTLTEASEDERKTPLGEQLDEFGTTLSYIIGGICICVWLASIPHFTDSIFDEQWAVGAVYYAKVGVALGVAAIPEGLPAVITLCLSLGTRRMAERNVIVRKLPSVETLGCTSVICTDKTGTLTSNQMTAVLFVSLETTGDERTIRIVEHKVTGSSYNPVGSVVDFDRDDCIQNNPSGMITDACDIMALCNDARLMGNDVLLDDESKEASVAQYTIEGEPTEAALLCLVEKLGPRDNSGLGAKPSAIASQNYQLYANRWDRYATLEFDRKRKSMSVLVKEREGSATKLFVKGAPAMLLRRCTHVKLRGGQIVPISLEVRDQIEDTIGSIGGRALRCIGLAMKDGNSLDSNLLKENQQYNEVLKDSGKFADIETGLTFVGLVAIRDPPRPGVSESIDLCKEAGIRVIMITGDAKATAVAIAKDVHIFHNESDGKSLSPEEESMKAFEGREFFALPESQQLDILTADNLVICRAEPADKQRLVKMLQSLGEIPAMTGDGVNDAPALQQASIGIAMGISGTEVAKEASDMVLVDDNFSTIVDAVEEGRCIYANMQAFINFLITCNIGEVIGVFLATILGFPQLLTPLHLLWVNLVTDGPPATALGFNPPDPELMIRKPRPTSEEILTPALLLRYSVGGLYIGLATVGIYGSYFLDHGISLQDLSSWSTCDDLSSCSVFTDLAAPQTLALTTLVTSELFKALCTVSVDSSILKVGPQKNPWLIAGVAVPFALNLAIIYTPAFQSSFGLVSLDEKDWLHVFMWSFPIILIDELQKYIFRSKLEAF